MCQWVSREDNKLCFKSLEEEANESALFITISVKTVVPNPNSIILISGYPKDISVGFTGIPNNVDSAFVWGGNGKIYFFKVFI